MPHEREDYKSVFQQIWVLELINLKISLYYTDNTSKESLYDFKWPTQITHCKDILNILK